MYVVSTVIVLLIFINYFLGVKLYSKPKNENFFNNVNRLDFSRERYITPNPKYVTIISILTGMLIGAYIALSVYFEINKWVAIIIVTTLIVCYLIEITRRITIKENKLILSKLFSKQVEIVGNQIKGIYIYSYNKKFLKKRALTTKLVVVTNADKFYKFVLSSLDNKAVLNMIKENFGVSSYKMYIGKTVEQDV